MLCIVWKKEKQYREYKQKNSLKSYKTEIKIAAYLGLA